MGTALVGLWAAGTGVASATEGEGLPSLPSVPGCEDVATIAGYGEGELPIDCSAEVTVTVVVTGDCLDPETFTFAVDAEGLEGETGYTIVFSSEAFVATDGADDPFLAFPFDSDENGDFSADFPATEDASVQVTSGAFTVDYEVYADDSESEYPITDGSVDVEACEETAPPMTTAPAAPTPTTTAPATTTVAPVVVHPAAAAPAVLANTGAPVTAAALFGGGLLVAGAGALVATRRRTS